MKEKLTINEQLLDKCLAAGLNVMFHGVHGTGKTSMVLAAFERANLNYKYFSASTMDPWIDFIGVPREMQDERGHYLELVRPKAFRDNEIEVIFLDEYNRAPKKIRNAVMELIQFKSINGHIFPNLKAIWTAVNPDDGNYDTEGMDPAQIDRFQIHITVPNKPDPKFFAAKFGEHIAEAAIAWWKGLSEDIQSKISPRRLDYALECYNMGIELRGYVLPAQSNVKKLMEDLSKGPAELRFNQLLNSEKRAPMQEFLADENNFSDCEKLIANSNKAIQFCVGLLSPEKQQLMVSRHNKVQKFVFDNSGRFSDIITRIAKDGQNPELKEQAQAIVEKIKERVDAIGTNNDPFASEKRLVSKYVDKTVGDSIKFNNQSYDNNIHNSPVRSVLDIEPQSVIDAKTTQQRTPIVEIDLPDSISINMSKEEAIYAMQILDFITARSQQATLIRIKNIVPTINTIVMALQLHSPELNMENIAGFAPYVMSKLVPALCEKGEDFIFIKK